ncbi:hypothetical protein PVAG01_05932 [Phlyctema vagabunda]|uniref:Uncharacterized protein n=1 Tax=Phlyctema vagabunda TaxID=108571 RepID=A0ABR4PFK2_9HELO
MNEKVRTARYIHPDFSFTVFRMIMKRYRQGNDGEKLLGLLAYQSGAVMEGAQVKQVIATPKIVGGRLLMRLQTAYVVPPKGAAQTYLLSRNLLKCPHTNQWWTRNRTVGNRLNERFKESEMISRDSPEHVISFQCYYCSTEFHFSLQQFDGEGVLLFVTKWQDLGTGISPLESDLPPVVGRRRDTCTDPDEGRIAYISPKDRFEAHAPDDEFQSPSFLTSEKRDLLFKKGGSMLTQFKKNMLSARWSMIGFGQYHPQYITLKLGTRIERMVAVARYMEESSRHGLPHGAMFFH